MSTPAYCTKCLINWANLWSDNNRHGVDFCPCCKSDSSLEDAKEGDSFIRSVVSGKIINAITKKPFVIGTMQHGTLCRNVEFDIKAWEQKQEAEQEKQLVAIAKYHEVYESQGPEIAEQLYFKVLKQK
jgi:hypothetical protein